MQVLLIHSQNPLADERASLRMENIIRMEVESPTIKERVPAPRPPRRRGGHLGESHAERPKPAKEGITSIPVTLTSRIPKTMRSSMEYPLRRSKFDVTIQRSSTIHVSGR